MSRPSPADARRQILDMLGDSVMHALGLKETLHSERRALEEQDTDALSELVQTKSDCVEKLSKLEQRRQQLCEAAGFMAGLEQMDQLVDWCDENSAISKCWLQLMEIAADCNALNMTNGAIIRMRSQMVDSSLAVLRGTDPNQNTYQRQGQDAAARNQRSLAEA